MLVVQNLYNLAKFRQNHQRSGKKPFAGMMIKLFLIFGILAALFVLLFQRTDMDEWNDLVVDPEMHLGAALVPGGNKAEIVEHSYYTLGYNEDFEQAEWVVYELTKESLRIPNVERSKRFNEDFKVSTKSVKHRDYSGSGYTRGHLAPAGDMAFSTEAMQESFLMSNMSPQISGFNGGVWKELEESVRDWAYRNEHLYVATGPVLENVTEYIGKQSKIGVPKAFYKVVVDLNRKGGVKGIGFVIPHEVSEEPLESFAMSIDGVENLVNLNFFNNLYDSEDSEKNIESTFEIGDWPFSQKRFENRINIWNKN